jgi:moderate conductance mechanosensitive channel
MNDFLTRLVSIGTRRDLLWVLLDPALLLLLFALLRALALRPLRALPRSSFLSGWAADVEALVKRLFGLILGVALLGDLALNLWLVGSGRDLAATKLAFLTDLYTRHRAAFLLYLGVAAAAVVVNIVLLRIAGKLIGALTRWAQNVDAIKGNDEAVAASFTRVREGLETTSWLYLLAAGTSKLPFLPASVPEALHAGFRVYIVYAVARVAWSTLEIVVTTLDGLAKRAAEKREKLRYYDFLKPLFPTLRRALEAAILVVGASFAVAQVQAFETLSGFAWIGLRVVGLLFAAQVVSTIFALVLRELFIREGSQDSEETQRRLTVLPLLASAARYVIFGFAIVMSLTQFGVDPMPVLAGAGVAGVAVGLGAQGLITDLVSGLFILWESYFVVGDYVQIGERAGIVESISLRVTSLRDDEGRVHIVPNGKIEGIVNYSKGYVAAEVGVRVNYEEDLDKVYAALEEVSGWVAENVSDALEAPEIEGVDDFSEVGIVVKLSTKVKPGKHLTTARIIRKRIKEVFDLRGIAFAQPRRVLDLSSEGSREALRGRAGARRGDATGVPGGPAGT